jgi:DNA (cytosine-5)-methyltransferase 1
VGRWEAVLGRAAPDPTEVSAGWLRDRARRLERRHRMPVGRRGSLRRFLRPERRLSPRFVEWMMGLPAGWVTEVPGVDRNDALRLLGNGVVPQQAAAAVASLLPVLADATAPPPEVDEGAA